MFTKNIIKTFHKNSLINIIFSYPPWSGSRLGTAVCTPSPYITRENKVSGLLLANHTSISNLFDQISTQCQTLLQKKIHFHHFKDHQNAESDLKLCHEKIVNLVEVYDRYNNFV